MKTFYRSLPLFLCCGLLALHSFADGVMKLTGKVLSFNKNEVVIEVAKSQLYTIRRSGLLKDDSDKLTRSEITVSFNVPMDAIKSVKDVPTPVKHE